MNPPSGGPMIGATSAGHVRGGDCRDELMFWRGAQHGQATHGHHQRATHALKDAHRNELIERGGQAAKYRGQREDRQREGKHFSRAEAVGDPAAGGDQHGQGDQVGADADIQIHGLVTEAFCHIRQRAVAITVPSRNSIKKAPEATSSFPQALIQALLPDLRFHSFSVPTRSKFYKAFTGIYKDCNYVQDLSWLFN